MGLANVNIYYELLWQAGARPPVHQNPMVGRQQFSSIMAAVEFFKKQPPDSEFIKLTEIVSAEVDMSIVFENIIEEEK